MNTLVCLYGLALASCVGLVLGYGSVATMGSTFTSYPYMNNMAYGYAPYVAPMGYGGFMGGGGGGFGTGTGGVFGVLIYLFVFIILINVLFSGNGLSGGLSLFGGGSKTVKGGGSHY